MTTVPKPEPRPLLRRLGIWLPFLAGLVHGVCMMLALPPIGLSWLCFLAAAPFWFVIEADRLHTTIGATTGAAIVADGTKARRDAPMRPLLSGLLAFAGAIAFWGYTEWWISDISNVGYPFLVLIEASWVGLFVWASLRIVRRWPRIPMTVLFPVMWVGIEFIRGELFGHGYAWGFISYPAIDTPVAGVARYGGVYAVSAVIAMVTGAAADAAQRRHWRWVAAAAAILTVVGVDFVVRKSGGAAISQVAKIAVLQTNVPQSNKIDWPIENEIKDWKHFTELTHSALPAKPGLIVWPETMMPGLTLEPSAIEELRQKQIIFRAAGADGSERNVAADIFYNELLELSRSVKVPMLVGEDARENMRAIVKGNSVRFEQDRRYNSVYMVNRGQVDPVRYDKVCLTPFGETMPYIASVPGLQQKLLDFGATGMQFDLSEGTHRTVFEIPVAAESAAFRAVTPICFEITVGPYVRNLVYEGGKKRADVIVNVTNDGWFGSFAPARLQHLQIARWRCLELGVPMVRAANTGISAAIDADGRIMKTGPDGAQRPDLTDGVMQASVKFYPGGTIYGQVGDVVGWSMCAGTVGLLLATFVRRKKVI